RLPRPHLRRGPRRLSRPDLANGDRPQARDRPRHLRHAERRVPGPAFRGAGIRHRDPHRPPDRADPGAPVSRPRLGLAAVLLAAAGCGHDAADREYFAALRGEETGMTREEQIAHIDRAVILVPTRASYYETRAIYRIDLRQYDRAHADMDRAIALVDAPYLRFLRALVTCELGDCAGSLADFDEAIARQPANAQFYRGRSLARARVGDARGALADADHLVTTAPQMAESHYARGVALAGLGRTREALPEFDRATSIRPDLGDVLDARAAVS